MPSNEGKKQHKERSVRLRLTTQNRAVIIGLPEVVKKRFAGKKLAIYGDLKVTEYFAVFPRVNTTGEGCSLSKDGRLFIADGQARLCISEECELNYVLADDLDGVVFSVVGRERPSPEKLRHMLASPVRPPRPLFDKNQPTLFDELR